MSNALFEEKVEEIGGRLRRWTHDCLNAHKNR
jgi:hypothetical protein